MEESRSDRRSLAHVRGGRNRQPRAGEAPLPCEGRGRGRGIRPYPDCFGMIVMPPVRSSTA
jgi:hypothetical protein